MQISMFQSITHREPTITHFDDSAAKPPAWIRWVSDGLKRMAF